MANQQHTSTLLALMQLWGIPEEIAQRLSSSLHQIENGEQDRLIEFLATNLAKKQADK